ncbi:MAG: ArsR/SmtB family transcription factor [Anaerolineae bacterium]
MAEASEGYQAEARLYKALSHPVRLQILDLLSQREACVCHLIAALGQRQPYVSQQLAALREAGLVTDRRDGNLVYYRLREPGLIGLLAAARRMVTAERPELRRTYLTERSVTVPECSCPKCAGDDENARTERREPTAA